MLEKRITLFLFAVLAIALIYRIPSYHSWVFGKFGNEYANIVDQAHHLSESERMDSRFGNTYFYLNAMKQRLADVPNQNIVVLLPPQRYINDAKLASGEFEVPEPAVFYYFTGYSAITMNSPQVSTATWAILVNDHKLMIKSFAKPEFREKLLAIYKKYN